MSENRLPLLAARDATAPLAWHAGQAINARRYLAQVHALARTLPAEGPAVNLCQDRYRFALALGAALMRGHSSLMPPNALPETLRRLGELGAEPYAFVDDDAADAAGLRRVVVQPDALEAVGNAARAGRGPEGTPEDGASGAIAEIDAQLEAVCLLTSGSTGTPQPHRKRWGPLVANIAAEASRLAELMDRPTLHGLTIVATVPPQHSYGFESSVLLALLGGAAFDSGRPFYPADIAAALARVPRPRALVTTPFHLKTLLAAGVELPVVDLVLSATAPLSPQLAAQAEARLGARLVEIYGCTEAGQVASRRTTEGEVWTALGELRLWREAQADGGERFLVAGGHVVEPTPLADILELLDDRHFRLLGRSNDLVHVAGKRSSLAHLDFHLNRVPGVVDGAFWVPDEVVDGVARTVAFVVAPGMSAREVIAGLRERLEPAFIPRRVVLLPELPREATGKITSATLRRLAAQHLGAPAPGARAAPQARSELDLAARHEAADPIVEIAADHPAFDGHFPGQPVLPGVVLLGLVLQALARRPELQTLLGGTPTIEQVKFTAPVRPGARLRVRLAAAGSGVAFELHEEACSVARGKLMPG
ncbi:MAG: AMP-binding protein [Burkholderiales bacterium]|nr:AMP-binding protein [Burkholderiales bacterium]